MTVRELREDDFVIVPYEDVLAALHDAPEETKQALARHIVDMQHNTRDTMLFCQRCLRIDRWGTWGCWAAFWLSGFCLGRLSTFHW